MSKIQVVFVALTLVMLGSYLVLAQQAPAQRLPMTFFITSSGSGDGGNLARPLEGFGGLAGADRRCQILATAAGGGNRTWHAYLSTNFAGSNSGVRAINARDRIGPGPWYNAKGVMIAKNVDDLHGDANNLSKQTALTEKGEMVNGVGDTPNRHDMLTGSQPDGKAYPASSGDHTCHNWASSGTGTAQLGHHDRTGGGFTSWNSAHPSSGCSQAALASTGGAGLYYCFAID